MATMVGAFDDGEYNAIILVYDTDDITHDDNIITYKILKDRVFVVKAKNLVLFKLKYDAVLIGDDARDILDAYDKL